jgi:glycosyltransferase involved in cell wall biosynthesis
MSISIITACKNRSKALAISVSSWMQFDEVDEIIITNWNSDDPIDHLTVWDKKVKIINVKDETYFNQPQPLNLAASLVKSDYILKLDCDHLFNPYFNFFDFHQIQENSFITGSNSLLKGMDFDFLHPLWGLLYVSTETFRKVGGYNENMGKYYAVEDDELAVRLISYGLTPILIDAQKLSALHIPHTNKDRVKNFESFESISQILSEFGKDFVGEELYNYMVKLCKEKNHNVYPTSARMMEILNFIESDEKFDKEKQKETINSIEWYSKPLYKWEITQINDQIYEAVKI